MRLPETNKWAPIHRYWVYLGLRLGEFPAILFAEARDYAPQKKEAVDACGDS